MVRERVPVPAELLIRTARTGNAMLPAVLAEIPDIPVTGKAVGVTAGSHTSLGVYSIVEVIVPFTTACREMFTGSL
jgi:hypothetical protein